MIITSTPPVDHETADLVVPRLRSRKWKWGIGLLAAVYLCVFVAGFVAPYDPLAQDRDHPFAPPTRLHFVDRSGTFQLRPFVHPLVRRADALDEYEEDQTRTYAVRFFVQSTPYTIAGLFRSDRHLLGTDSPSRLLLLGTDEYGRDLFSRLLYGGQISLLAGLLGAGLSLAVGILLGTVAGFYGSWVDDAIMRLGEIFLALPWLYLLLAARLMLPLHIDPGLTFLLLVAVLAVVGWARPARLVRGLVLSARLRDYVVAARSFGASDFHLVRWHVLPHVRGLALTQAALLIPQYTLAEVTLSFLGLGVGEPVPSWGNMLASVQRYHVLASYWWMFAPGLVLIPLFLLYSTLADALHRRTGAVAVTVVALLCTGSPASAQQSTTATEALVSRADVGRFGGQLVVVQRGEPRTLNPVTAIDNSSREVIGRTIGDLIHINRETHQTEPALAKSWKVSPDRRRYTLALRRGVRFSDGDPFDADDVVFSFQVYLDEKLGSANRDLLIVGGQPIAIRKVDQYTVEMSLAQPYAVAERIFDSIAMLPRHKLEAAYKEGRFGEAWGVRADPATMAGLGPFRFKEYVPGQRIVLERNPYFWKIDRKGKQLPYLDRLVFLYVPSEDAQTVRFESGDAHILTRMNSANFGVLSNAQRKKRYELYDIGAGLDYTFLFFNLNDVDSKTLPALSRRQAWFRQVAFRQAVSLAIDRDAIVRLVYRGRATPLWGHVPPGNKLWVNRSIARPARSVERARQLLQKSGFSWTNDGALVDDKRQPVEFTLITTTGNAERNQIATIIQDDLKQLGMRVGVATLEGRALQDRLFSTFDYDACVLALGAPGDADPNTEMNVWLSSGSTHLWHVGQTKPATAWEAEIDALMQRQLMGRDQAERKRLFDRVQELVVANVPIISLVSPNALVGAKKGLGNFRPTVLDHRALWNVEELFWRERQPGATQ